MQIDFHEIILLGLVPGTNIQLSLEGFLIVLCVLFLLVECARLYIYHHYRFRAKHLNQKIQKLLTKHNLL